MSSVAVRVIAVPLSLALGSLSRLRKARVFHPRGIARHATVRIEGGDHPLAAMEGTHAGIVRTSRALGTPAPLPDIWGIALRVFEARQGPGADGDTAGDVDVLMATTGSGPVGRRVLVPVRRPATHLFSTLLPLSTPSGRRCLLGARATAGDAREAGDRMELLSADPTGPWRVVGEVVLAAALPTAEGRALRFSPWAAPPGLELAGPFNELRRPAYLASQAARPDT